MLKSVDCSLIIPVFNQWSYTEICLESLFAADSVPCETLVVDNGSGDGTPQGLSRYPSVKVLTNPTNLGCARAWNQGLEASGGTAWKIFLNNDVKLGRNTLEALIRGAEREGFAVACPAMWQGQLDYDFENISRILNEKLRDFPRRKDLHGVCFAVRSDVFEKVGRFDEHFEVGQFEDADFFRRVQLAGYAAGTLADAFLHHFGSVTQIALRDEGKTGYADKNRAYYRKKWGLHWVKRKIEKLRTKAQIRRMERFERARCGLTMVRGG
jgi:N-acetylglucosaminyl-diphospho-decaprenol L-rhamnosyltransferase